MQIVTIKFLTDTVYSAEDVKALEEEVKEFIGGIDPDAKIGAATMSVQTPAEESETERERFFEMLEDMDITAKVTITPANSAPVTIEFTESEEA